ncbi:MAG: hypothetical protein II843_04535 [Alphaproteobacteria bacterium]|nr:hypothetical protein [Alphaproteobacteria bacterium]MBQ6011541.1 hypothetical protein [Alphaproteobacteria bacterium]
MRNKFEHFLLSFLLGIAVLLGLSFWLNVIYGFNLFSKEHWNELARLQAEQIPVSTGFYVSIIVAVFIFVFGILLLYIIPTIKRTREKVSNSFLSTAPMVPNHKAEEKKEDNTIFEPQMPKLNMSQPPKLNLPSNMAEIMQQRNENNQNKVKEPVTDYDAILTQIFKDKGFMVKPNPVISGFSPNLFAIAPNEIVWIGAVDTDINKLQFAINRLDGIFNDTLEDIKININAFLIDTKNTYQSNASIFVFKTLEELKTFVTELPPAWPKDMSNADQENFDAYSEYIDTIIQYVKNMG